MAKPGPEAKYTEQLHVMVRKETPAKLKKRAKKEGKTVSKLVREWIERGLAK